MLKLEWDLYTRLHNIYGIVTPKTSRCTVNYRSIKMPWLGQDLGVAFEEAGRKFPLPTVVAIGLSLVRCFSCLN